MCKDGAESLVRAGGEGARDVPRSTLWWRNTEVTGNRALPLAGCAPRGKSECAEGCTFIAVCINMTSQTRKRKLYFTPRHVTPEQRFKQGQRKCRLMRVNYGTCRTLFWGKGGLCGMMTQREYVQGCRQGCQCGGRLLVTWDRRSRFCHWLHIIS